MKPIVTISVSLLALIVVAGFVWLASAPAAPPPQKVEQVLPDDRIPR